MYVELINIGLAFLEGLGLALTSPCILPILPIVLAGSVGGTKSRPLGIITGLILTFAVFSFFARQLVQVLHINLDIIRDVSFIMLILIGVIMLSNFLTEKFSFLTRRLANIQFTSSKQQPEGFVSGIIFRSLIGLVWVPCTGPILAAVLIQVITQKASFIGFLILISFGLGASIPMLVVIFFLKAAMAYLNFFKRHTVLFRKILGAIIIASVGFMIYLSGFSLAYAAINTDVSKQPTLQNGLLQPYPAPPIAGITAWINSSPLQLSQLKGKVVLIDFWTYSCINCVRTFPSLKSWYEKYHDKGLVLIGIHSPEFYFEKELSNVQNAVKNYGLKYPVALDNDFATWTNYHNEYWPGEYLIDQKGNVVYQHFGEGDYDVTENNIRILLGLNKTVSQKEKAPSSVTQTPETYLGYARAGNFHSKEPITKDASFQYHYPDNLPLDGWALNGNWKIASEKIVSTQPNAAIEIHFRAAKVYAVMGTAGNRSIKVQVRLNGKQVTVEKGKEVKDSSINVTHHDLYSLINLTQPKSGILEITADAPGLEIYTFTFG